MARNLQQIIRVMKMIFKALLFWTTSISIPLFIIGGAENLMLDSCWIEVIVWLIVNILLFGICRYTLSYKDCVTVSGAKFLNDLAKKL